VFKLLSTFGGRLGSVALGPGEGLRTGAGAVVGGETGIEIVGIELCDTGIDGTERDVETARALARLANAWWWVENAPA
jgi:hypothetical protein